MLYQQVVMPGCVVQLERFGSGSNPTLLSTAQETNAAPVHADVSCDLKKTGKQQNKLMSSSLSCLAVL